AGGLAPGTPPAHPGARRPTASRADFPDLQIAGPPHLNYTTAPNTSSRIGSSEGSSRGYAQGCPLVIHSNLRAGWSCPAAGPGLGPARNCPQIACLAAELPDRDWREDAVTAGRGASVTR